MMNNNENWQEIEKGQIYSEGNLIEITKKGFHSSNIVIISETQLGVSGQASSNRKEELQRKYEVIECSEGFITPNPENRSGKVKIYKVKPVD